MSKQDRLANIDLDSWSAAELGTLISMATEKRTEKMSGAREALLAEFREKAAELGLSLNALTGSGGGRPRGGARAVRSDAGSKVAPKYRDPESGKTWSGRGREPNWLKGNDRKRFEIT